MNQLTKKEMKDSLRFKKNLALVQIYRQRGLRNIHPTPSGDEYKLGDALETLTTVSEDGSSILKKMANKRKFGYALSPK